MRNYVLCLSFLFSIVSIESVYCQRKMESLDRGTVAIKTNGGVYISWRVNGTEWYDVAYNLYRDGTKINATPITGASNYTDAAGTLASNYTVKAVVNGVERNEQKTVSVLANPYMELKLREIPEIAGVPDKYYNDYRINDITAADLDGDGEYELIVKRVNEGYDSANPFENKYYTLIEAYKLDGTYLWTIDLGPNIMNAVEINVLAFDFDGDGKAEIVLRSSEGTVDGKGNQVGDVTDANGNPTPDGKTNYRDYLKQNSSWYEYKGPEFLSLYAGETGEELHRIDHISREPASQWGNRGMNDAQLAHRATKFHYGAPYLDGKKPSVFISRGIYQKIMMRTYDIVDKKFVFKWEFDSNLHPGYTSQGYHNYVIADVDNDGCDEIVYGSMTVDHDGKGLYTTELGHGDAMHVSDFDPYRKGLEIWACLESSPQYGSVFRAGESDEILWHRTAGRDMGRCMAANVSNKHKGTEMWDNDHMYSASERKEIYLSRGSTIFRIFWDGDLLEELATQGAAGPDNNGRKWEGKITKYNETSNTWDSLLDADKYYACNDTKGTPCLQADLFGDWREEIIFRSENDQSIRIYMTTIPTTHRIYSLMYDMQYRQAIAWQMCGYNQPPHPSFFVGEAESILLPPPPVMDNDRLVLQPGATAWNTSTAGWQKNGISTNYADGEEVLLDFLTMNNASPLTLSTTVQPGNVFVNSSGTHSLDASNGKLSGAMRLIKQGAGTFSLNGTHDYTGKTEIWDGFVELDGTLERSPLYMHLFGELSINGTIGGAAEMRYGSKIYPGKKDQAGTVTFKENLTLTEEADFMLDFGTDLTAYDKVVVKGNFDFSKGINLHINKLADEVADGDYTIAEVEGTLTGGVSAISIVENYNNLTVTPKIVGKTIVLSLLTVTHAEQPVIHTQPKDQAVNLNGLVSLNVNASVNDGGTLSYQWYSNTTNSTVGGTFIGSGTGSTYSPVAYSAKVTWYYVVVTNTNNAADGNQKASVTSEVVSVNVLAVGPMNQIIKNPSFEEGSYDNGSYTVPNGWNLSATFTGSKDITLPDRASSHGTFYYSISCDGTGNEIDLYQSVLLPAGEYTLKADLRAQARPTTALYASVGDEVKTAAPTSGSWSGGWGTSPAVVSFVVPENSTPVRIGVSAAARIMVDNFQLEKASNDGGTSIPIVNLSLAAVYPNPTDGLFTLDFVNEGSYTITLTDLTGSVLLRTVVKEQTKQIDIRRYPSGVYLLMIADGKQQRTSKIVKK